MRLCFPFVTRSLLLFGFVFFAFLPSSTRQRKLAALLALTCATAPPSIIAPSLASPSASSLHSVMNFSKSDICCKSFLERCALTCSILQYAVSMNSVCNSSKIRIQTSASFAVGPMYFSSPLHRPSMILLLSTLTIAIPIAFLRRHKEGRLLRSLCAVPQSSASSVPYIPCIGPISSSRSSCTTDHPHARHLPRTPNREPSVVTLVTETFR